MMPRIDPLKDPLGINEDDLLLGRLPLSPFLWNILLEPIKPISKKGLIELPKSAQDVEEIHITIARVLAVGPLAFQNNTEGGLDMRRFSHTITRPHDLIGRYVMHKRYAGNNMLVKLPSGGRKKLLLIDDDSLLGDVDDPQDFVFYLD